MNLPLVRRQQDLIAAFLRRRGRPGRLVELGCGDGTNLEFFSRLGWTGEGWDAAEEAVRLARGRGVTGFSVRQGDLHALELAGEPIVLMLLTLEHLREDEHALRKVRSYLAPGGLFILSVPAHTSAYSHQDRLVGHWRRYDREPLDALLGRCGFEVLQWLTVGFPWNSLPTRVYNAYLSWRRPAREVAAPNTAYSGISGHCGHMPREIGALSRFVFPLLSAVRFVDAPFLRTGAGTHHLVFCSASGRQTPV